MLAPAAPAVSALVVVQTPTPRFRVARFDTSGTYPQVRGPGRGLNRVNAAVRGAVLADQRSFAPYARREKPKIQYEAHGVYRTAVDRNLISASTVVVSALMPTTRELFPGQHGGDGWLGITLRVPSGTRVTIRDLFRSPSRGLRVLAAAWKARIRRGPGGPCLRIYPDAYETTAENYRTFALTLRGLAVGAPEVEACYRLVATVPYAVVRPYLSDLGMSLVDGVRSPAHQPPRLLRRNAAWFARSAQSSQQ